MDRIPFLSDDTAASLARAYDTPLFVYDAPTLRASAAAVMAFPAPFGLTVRYAVKALPTAAVVQLLTAAGLHLDCSSGFEAERVMRAGAPASLVQVTAQELPKGLAELLARGVRVTACSLHQLEVLCALQPGREMMVRVNPGLGSGFNNRTNVGGSGSSFGIWHGALDQGTWQATPHPRPAPHPPV